MVAKQKNLLVIAADFTSVEEETRSLSSKAQKVFTAATVSAETLKEGIRNISEGISEALDGINETIAEYTLEEISIKLEISATGQVAILGSGVSATSTGGLELKFTKKKKDIA